MSQVSVWQYENQTGNRSDLPVGEYRDLSKLTIGSNSITCIEVPAFFTLTLFYSADFKGVNKAFKGPLYVGDLKLYDNYWNNQAVSAKVTYSAPSDATLVSCCTGGLVGAPTCGPYSKDSPSCGAFISGYCNASHITEPICKTWAENNRLLAEPIVRQFCASNPSDPYCSCILSKVISTASANPACIDSSCIMNSGFKTQSMLQVCPSITTYTCTQINSLKQAGVNIGTDITATMNCGTTTTSTPTQGTATSDGVAGGDTSVDDVSADKSSSKKIIIILLLFFLVIILAAVAAYFFAGDAIAAAFAS